jgi:hypothetical protein
MSSVHFEQCYSYTMRLLFTNQMSTSNAIKSSHLKPHMANSYPECRTSQSVLS